MSFRGYRIVENVQPLLERNGRKSEADVAHDDAPTAGTAVTESSSPVPVPHSPCFDVASDTSKITGAIAIGALVNGDVASGEAYSKALVYHLGDVLPVREPKAAPALGLMAVYWQHQGDDRLKLKWLDNLREALGDSHVSDASLFLILAPYDISRALCTHAMGLVGVRVLHG